MRGGWKRKRKGEPLHLKILYDKSHSSEAMDQTREKQIQFSLKKDV